MNVCVWCHTLNIIILTDMIVCLQMCVCVHLLKNTANTKHCAEMCLRPAYRLHDIYICLHIGDKIKLRKI